MGEERRVDHAEDRGRGADAKREREYRGEGETRVRAELAGNVTQIMQDSCHPNCLPRPRRGSKGKRRTWDDSSGLRVIEMQAMPACARDDPSRRPGTGEVGLRYQLRRPAVWFTILSVCFILDEDRKAISHSRSEV